MGFFNKRKEKNQINADFMPAEEMRQISESHKSNLSREQVALLQRERIMYLIQMNAEEGRTDLYYSCSDGTADYIDYVDEKVIEELRNKGYEVEYDDDNIFEGVWRISW